MNKKEFSNWIEKYLREHSIDIHETFDIEVNGEKHTFSFKNVIEILKMTNENEQAEIKKMLEVISDSKSNIKDYFICLSIGFCHAVEQTIEDEEAM